MRMERGCTEFLWGVSLLGSVGGTLVGGEGVQSMYIDGGRVG